MVGFFKVPREQVVVIDDLDLPLEWSRSSRAAATGATTACEIWSRNWAVRTSQESGSDWTPEWADGHKSWVLACWTSEETKTLDAVLSEPETASKLSSRTAVKKRERFNGCGPV